MRLPVDLLNDHQVLHFGDHTTQRTRIAMLNGLAQAPQPQGADGSFLVLLVTN